MKLAFTLLFILTIGIGNSFAQNYNFTIHYPLDINFSASGDEKQQIIELSNGNLVMYRFEYDSIVMEHKMRYWCTDPMANMVWNKEFLLGNGDSLNLSGSLCTNGDNFILAFTKVLGFANSEANIIKCNDSGDILESVRLNLPNAYQVRNFSAVSTGNEYAVGGTIHNQFGQTSVFIAGSFSQSFQNPTIYTTNELHSLSTLYLGQNQSLHLVGAYNNRTTDVKFQWFNEAVGKKIPENIYVRMALYDTAHGTYYAGYDIGTNFFPNAVLMMSDTQGNNWYRQLQISGQMFHGSTASDLIFHNGGVSLMGYSSVPIPTTFITEFGMDGTIGESKRYNSFHTFNYNAGELFRHTNGHIYISKLGGIFINDTSAYATAFVCLNADLDNNCNGVINPYSYDSIPIITEADTLFFQQEGTATLNAQTVINGTLSEIIICHTNLGLSEVSLTEARLYPNPFSTSTTLMLPEGFSLLKTEISCTDALGRELPFNSSMAGENKVQIQFDESVKGLVIFHLKNGKNEGVVRGVLE